ncbi:DUF4124 domain-containing protein [Marinobacter sp. G11]|uniref:DUF4124 domain-containing protein n=1 Tax=Marinobacter sp. G11 TaxID=2903522 RepID=UPI003FA5AAD0
MLLISLSIPALGHTAVYQCKTNGQTVFSDQPCGEPDHGHKLIMDRHLLIRA